MTLKFTAGGPPEYTGRTLFVSASIPDPEDWHGDYDALAITDAVVAITQTFLTDGWSIVSAAHPTIAPLMLSAAHEHALDGQERVVIYQSKLYEGQLPAETRRFRVERVGRFEWTEKVEGDEPVRGKNRRSLELMRNEMFSKERPDAAVFVGGMEGITDEFDLFAQVLPGRPRYALASPGGAARDLPDALDGVVYPTLARTILAAVAG